MASRAFSQIILKYLHAQPTGPSKTPKKIEDQTII